MAAGLNSIQCLIDAHDAGRTVIIPHTKDDYAAGSGWALSQWLAAGFPIAGAVPTIGASNGRVVTSGGGWFPSAPTGQQAILDMASCVMKMNNTNVLFLNV